MSFAIQQQIKNNAQDIREYVTELYKWEQEKDEQQELNRQRKKEQLEAQPKVQKKVEDKKDSTTTVNNEEFKKLKRDVNNVSDYYKAWDKFDVDKEVEELEKSEQRKPYNPYENSLNNIRAKPQAKMAVKGGREVIRDPTSLKDRGNLHFKSCEYQKAIEYYTECLDKLAKLPEDKNNRELTCIVLSNRAMANLKLSEFKLAQEDCTKSLELDATYVKSYLRRATALKKLRRFKEALSDYRKAAQLDPSSTEAKDESKRIDLYLDGQKKQARESLIRKNVGMLKSERLPIEDVDEDEDELQKARPVNYLEEL